MKDRLRAIIHTLVRVLAGADVLYLASERLLTFQSSQEALASYGFPVPAVMLAVALLIGIPGGVALIIGRFTRPASLAVLLVFLPVTAIFLALYSNNSWGELQWLLQLLRVVEAPAVAAALFFLAFAGSGSSRPGRRDPTWIESEEEMEIPAFIAPYGRESEAPRPISTAIRGVSANPQTIVRPAICA